MCIKTIRDVNSLINNISKAYQPEYLFFWGHQRRKDGRIGKQCLSQWWPCTFTIDRISYRSAEQFVMAEKARLFGDEEKLAEILQASGPAEAKKLGREVSGFEEDDWEKRRGDFAVRANEAKFGQNQELKAYLLGTEAKVLVEASPADLVWGSGLVESDPGAKDPRQWRGLNLLGFALMEVRERLLIR